MRVISVTRRPQHDPGVENRQMRLRCGDQVAVQKTSGSGMSVTLSQGTSGCIVEARLTRVTTNYSLTELGASDLEPVLFPFFQRTISVFIEDGDDAAVAVAAGHCA